MNSESPKRTRGWIGLLALAAAGLMARPASGQLLYAIDNVANTLARIDPSNGAVTTVGPVGHQFFTTDLTYYNNSIYAITANSTAVFDDPGWTLVEINRQTGAKIRSISTLLANGQRPRLIEGIATIGDRLVLGMQADGTVSQQLGDIDPATGTITNIVGYAGQPGCNAFGQGGFSPDFDGLGTDPAGRILASDSDLGLNTLGRITESPRSCTILGQFNNFSGFDDVASADGSTFGIGRGALYQFNLTGTPFVARSLNLGEANVNLTGLAAAAAEGVTYLNTGSTWRYLDNGSNQGVAWRQPGFNDSAWRSGPSPLGYGDGDEATVVGCTAAGAPCPASAANKFITTYFRAEFEVEAPDLVENLVLELVRDDGAAVYLNGIEVARDRLTDGASFNTLADSPAVGGDDESRFYSFSVDPALLVAGRNVLAAEVHQQATSSSDLSFDVRLRGQIVPVPEPAGWILGGTLVGIACAARLGRRRDAAGQRRAPQQSVRHGGA